MEISLTLIFVVVTSAVSILAFNNYELFSKLQFNPYKVYHKREYYRLLTHGLIHADWTHLIINMLVFMSFGTNVERCFRSLEVEGYMHHSGLWFTLLYLGAIIIASLTTLKKYRDNFAYNSVGASGGVSAITFCSIFFGPFDKITLYFLLPVPGILFGILYLIYTQYMSKRSMDNINHDAHFLGAVFGFVFPLFINYKFIYIFIDQLLHH